MSTLSELEKEKLANADRINAYLSVSSIPEAAQAAQQRARQQAAARLQAERDRAAMARQEGQIAARAAENQLDREFRREEGALDRAGALERAETMAGLRQQEKLRERMQQAQGLFDSLNVIDQRAAELGETGTGELGGPLQQVIKYGPDWVGDVGRKFQSDKMTDLNTRGTLLQTQIAKAFMSGVLSDQDLRMLGPLALKGDLNEDQIEAISGALRTILAGKYGLGQVPQTTGTTTALEPQDPSAPVVDWAAPATEPQLSPTAQKWLD